MTAVQLALAAFFALMSAAMVRVAVLDRIDYDRPFGALCALGWAAAAVLMAAGALR